MDGPNEYRASRQQHTDLATPERAARRVHHQTATPLPPPLPPLLHMVHTTGHHHIFESSRSPPVLRSCQAHNQPSNFSPPPAPRQCSSVVCLLLSSSARCVCHRVQIHHQALCSAGLLLDNPHDATRWSRATSEKKSHHNNIKTKFNKKKEEKIMPQNSHPHPHSKRTLHDHTHTTCSHVSYTCTTTSSAKTGFAPYHTTQRRRRYGETYCRASQQNHH